MNIKSIILGVLSIIVAIFLFFIFFWAAVIFIILAVLFMIYWRIRMFFMLRKAGRGQEDIEAEYEEESIEDDVVLVTAPDGTTEEIHLNNEK
ncbi:MAG: hypothetical protein PF692_04445 [Kiritimatiellae bacterium]|jgi:uncharacterized membrane protein|nr:hypothetical protein [Kiritimatiellia bacterium]